MHFDHFAWIGDEISCDSLQIFWGQCPCVPGKKNTLINSTNLEPDQPAASAPPLTEQNPQDDPANETSEGTVPVLEMQEPQSVKNSPNPECIRKIDRLYDKADRITKGFTFNHKIAYSGCQCEIEESVWKDVKKKPLEYFIGEKLDEDKIRES
jgi:hypothetical protein